MPQEQPAQLEGGLLTVYSGRAGVVRVGERLAAVAPFGPTRMFGVGAGPYALRFERADQLLVVRGVPGPVVDLRPLQGFTAPPVGQPVTLSVTAVSVAGALVRGVVVIDGQRVSGDADADGLRFEVPGSGALVVVVGWYRDGRLLALDRLDLPQARGFSGVVARPRYAADETLVVDVRGDRPAWVVAELTVVGVRTGLPLGAGLGGGRVGVDVPQAVAVGLPRPSAVTLGDLGMWVETRTRTVGATGPRAQVGESLALATAAHAVVLPPVLATLPIPARAAEGATPLPEHGVLEVAVDPETTLLRADVTAHDACLAVAWSLVDDAAPGALDLTVDGGGPAAAPLIAGTLSALSIGDTQGVAAVVAAEGPRPEQWPRYGPRVTLRTVSGHFRGTAPACSPSDPRRGRYAVQRADAECPAGRRAPEVLVDACGRITPLEPGDGAVPLLCGQAAASLGAPDDAGRLPVLGGGTPRWLVPVDRAAARPPPSLTGGWYRAEVVETRHTPNAQGAPGPLLGSPATLFVGEPSEGPFFEAEADGTARLEAGVARFAARFTQVDATGGALRVDAPACLDEARTVTATATAEGLTLREVVPVDDALRVRVVTLRRR